MVFRFILFLYMMAVAIVFTINPPWLNLFAAPFPIWSRWTGVGLGVLNLPLLIWVHHTLGKHWSTNLQLRQSHALITEGPYRWVRHPMYMALFSFFVGLALISASWLIVVLVVCRDSGAVCADWQGRDDDDRAVWRRVPRLHATHGTLSAALVNCH